MLAGFEVPTEGRILLEGEPVENVPPYERNVNMVFQSYALFGHLDVENNVAFGLKRRKVPKDEIKVRVAEALELVSLSSRATARPNELSGGQRQRVALARALVNRPAVLLLDEPLGALDLKLRRQMQVELKQIQREVGITFVYVTHDQEEALSMSDRIAVMSEGRIAQCGPPEDVYEHPAEEFVAGFIGISNLLEGQVETVANRTARRGRSGSERGRGSRRPFPLTARAATRSSSRSGRRRSRSTTRSRRGWCGSRGRSRGASTSASAPRSPSGWGAARSSWRWSRRPTGPAPTTAGSRG